MQTLELDRGLSCAFVAAVSLKSLLCGCVHELLVVENDCRFAWIVGKQVGEHSVQSFGCFFWSESRVVDVDKGNEEESGRGSYKGMYYEHNKSIFLDRSS